jgi:hypothetical protein
MLAAVADRETRRFSAVYYDVWRPAGVAGRFYRREAARGSDR